ncbi:hypothetical protein M427DRAFT_140420 [Gonapodya prolifera JEL478]|uniref:Sec1-like protein n=1 Tax=Gonapodya prolifera (strain JEL478) TaxID=1344416 RepID=A0A138ZZ19_GONPJ|nr:hypothetical protein M427DRAFT_140420 [Gonapodya prolifera JEL478]|eukprot:KXS09754.1 hypothetical protein M427DRAFT_140420 [Gonapodya prolifera JEL478]
MPTTHSPLSSSPQSPTSLLTTATDRIFANKGADWIKAVNGAIVYLDAGASASIAWNLAGGVPGLLDAGAISVREVEYVEVELESREQQEQTGKLFHPNPESVTFLLASPLPNALPAIRRVLLSSTSSYSRCSVFTALSEDWHVRVREARLTEFHANPQFNLDDEEQDLAGFGPVDWAGLPSSFAAVEHLLAGWMEEAEKRNPEVEPTAHVKHAPLGWAQVTSNFFLSTGTESVWPGPGRPGEPYLPASRLSLLLDHLHVQDHLFAFGDGARLVAREIAQQSVTRDRRSSARLAGVVVVDRTLDLSPPLSHSDHPLDLAFSLLSPTSPQPVVPASAMLGPSTPATPFQFSTARAGSTEALVAWDDLTSLSQRDGVMALRRRIADSATEAAKEGVDKPPKMLGRATPAHLLKLLSLFQNSYDALEARQPLLSLAAAVALAMSHPRHSRWDELAAAEKVLALAGAETGAVGEAAAVVAGERDRCLARGEPWTWEKVEEVCGLVGYAIGLGPGVLDDWDEGRWEVEIALVKEALVRCVMDFRHVGTEAGGGGEGSGVTAKDDSNDDIDLDWSWGDDEGASAGKSKKLDEKNRIDGGTLGYAEREQRRRSADDWVARGLEKLVEAARLRGRMTRYRPNPTPTDPHTPPLLSRMVSDILAPGYSATTASSVTNYGSKLLSSVQATATAGEMFESDMWHVSYGIMNYLGNMGVGGISRFLASNISSRARGGPIPPTGSSLHPAGQYPVLLVYVLGGISFHEVQAIREAVRSAGRTDVEVIVGATSVATPKNVVDHVFGAPWQPDHNE